jgi:predicted secreted protein
MEEAAEGAAATEAQEEVPAEAVAVEVQEEAPAEAGLVDIASILGAPTVTVVRSIL